MSVNQDTVIFCAILFYSKKIFGILCYFQLWKGAIMCKHLMFRGDFLCLFPKGKRFVKYQNW